MAASKNWGLATDEAERIRIQDERHGNSSAKPCVRSYIMIATQHQFIGHMQGSVHCRSISVRAVWCTTVDRGTSAPWYSWGYLVLGGADTLAVQAAPQASRERIVSENF